MNIQPTDPDCVIATFLRIEIGREDMCVIAAEMGVDPDEFSPTHLLLFVRSTIADRMDGMGLVERESE